MIAFDVLKFVWSHPANRHRRVRAVTRACTWQALKRLTGKPWTIDCFDGLKMRCYPDSDGGGLMIYTNGMIDYDDTRFIQAYLRPGDAFVDIGANIGVYTLLAASLVGPRGKVLAFEPGHRAFPRLQENVSLNGLAQVELHCAAVGESAGEVLFLQKHDLINRIVEAGQTDETGAERVPCVPLDDALAGRQFSMGKIDVEGAEPMIFRGSTRALQQGNPRVWLLELKDRLLQRYGFSAAEFGTFLREHAYELGSYTADTGELLFEDEPWVGRENVIAIHTSAVDLVRERLAEQA